jgi:type IV conjugative transfer system coupling protein TraD
MKNIIRGGQTSMHSFHMSTQLVLTLVKVALLIILIGDLIYVFGKFDLQDLKEISIYYLAKILVFTGFENFQFIITGRYGDIHQVKAIEVINNLKLISIKNGFFTAVLHGLLIGFLSALVVIVSLISIFNFRGKKLAKEKFLRGAKIVSKKLLKKKIQKFNFEESLKNLRLPCKSQYSIAQIPFPRNVEFLHTIILGSTGTGKTNGILDILDQVRKNGDRAIIYDKMGTFTSTYYDSSKDIILNPLDVRSKSWSFFKEIRNESDYDYMASAFIQEKKGNSDQFWIDAARRVFAVFAKKFKEERGNNATNKEFVDALLKVGYEELAEFLTGTEAAALVSTKSERTSLSILSILATHLSSMKYLGDSEENFSIRKWVETDSDGFLFISSRSDQHDSLQPLISTWIDIAVKALLSVEQNDHNSTNPRRIFIILDEIGSLQQLPSLLDGLAQSRQFGGSFLLSLHSISQLRSVYGKDKTETITSLCRNKIFFAGADDETSDYCSQNLGYQENEEVKEGISYGANEIRDGVSLSTQKNLRRVVIASEIMNMKALEAYLKFAGHFPITKISFKIKKRPKIAERFVDILPVTSDQNLTEVAKLAEDENVIQSEIDETKETEQLSLLDYEEPIPEEDLEEETEEEDSFAEDDDEEDESEDEEDDKDEEEDEFEDDVDDADEEEEEEEEEPQEKPVTQPPSKNRPNIF